MSAQADAKVAKSSLDEAIREERNRVTEYFRKRMQKIDEKVKKAYSVFTFSRSELYSVVSEIGTQGPAQLAVDVDRLENLRRLMGKGKKLCAAKGVHIP